MNRLRVTSAGIADGHITPHWLSLASASAARMQAFMSSVYMISSPMRSSAWGRWALPSVSVIRSATPSTNSHLARFLAAPWCAVWVIEWVANAVSLRISTSPSTNTRSHGTSTSSKNTTQSISSKREARGWSKRERPRSKLSRQRNFSPGVPQGIAKLSAKGLWGSVCRARRGE